MLSEKLFRKLILAVVFVMVAGVVALVAVAVVTTLNRAPNVNVPNTDTGYFDMGDKAKSLKVFLPRPSQFISSPLVVTGEARAWYFEGSFPIELKDANGNILASGIATAQSDWMVDAFVPFVARLEFATPVTATGTLILKKDNPSGLPEHDDQIALPVFFNSSVK